MKKLILTSLSIILLPIAAFSAETRIGLSAALSFFTSDGTEITKSSGERNSKEIEEDAIVPGLFIERVNDNGFALGFEFNPDAKVNSSINRINYKEIQKYKYDLIIMRGVIEHLKNFKDITKIFK